MGRNRLRHGLALVCMTIASAFAFVAQSTETSGASKPQSEVTSEEAQAIAWFKQNAVPLSGSAPAMTELQPLMHTFDKARVIGIGEVTHGDHQDQDFKAELIKALIKDGRIDTLILECNRQAGRDFEAYAQGAPTDLTELVRSKHFFRLWQDDEFAGLLLWIRAWNKTASHQVHIIGVDLQDALTDARFAMEFVAAQDHKLARRLRVGLKPTLSPEAQKIQFYKWLLATPKPTFLKAQASLNDMLAAFDTHASQWSRFDGYDAARYAARTAVQGFKTFDAEAGDPKFDFSKAPSGYVNRRDIFMAANMLERLGPSGRGALWAHDMHVIGNLPDEVVAQGYMSQGTELHRQLGKDYISIGFAWSDGAFNAPLTNGWSGDDMLKRTEWKVLTLPNNRPGDLGYVLSKVGISQFYVDLRHPSDAVVKWGKTPYFRGLAGAGVSPQNWQISDEDKMGLLPSHDILIYFHTITPSHMWPLKP